MQGPARPDRKDKNFPDITGSANESVVKIMEIQGYHGHLSSIACDAGRHYKMGVPEMLPSVGEVLPNGRSSGSGL
jgi:hypothetical protein